MPAGEGEARWWLGGLAEIKLSSEQCGGPISIVEISEPAAVKKGLPASRFFLVIDRMSFSADERGRLADSLGKLCHGAPSQAWVVAVAGVRPSLANCSETESRK